MCFEFIDKYSAEKETLIAEIETLEENLKTTESTKQTADDFIKAIKKYLIARMTAYSCVQNSHSEHARKYPRVGRGNVSHGDEQQQLCLTHDQIQSMIKTLVFYCRIWKNKIVKISKHRVKN